MAEAVMLGICSRARRHGLRADQKLVMKDVRVN